MERSPELEAVALRRGEAFNNRDVETTLNLHSEDPGLIVIGTEDDEWWTGHEMLRTIVTAMMPELSAVNARIEVTHIDAFTEGSVGWIVGRLLVTSNTTSVPMRYTAVFHLERGVWRIVHAHSSNGVDGETSFGTSVTKVEHIADGVRIEQPDLHEAVAADGTVTIAFSDLERSTELAVRLGDRGWLELLRRHDRIVSDCAASEGCRVVKSLGDGHMLAFSSASRALRGSISIQRAFREAADGEPLRLRIGLHTGEVLREADDFFGHAVITAARVSAAASGNEILVSSLVHELTRSLGAFQFGEPRIAQLKGLPGDHQLFPVIWD